MIANCFTKADKSEAIQQKHAVQRLPLSGNQRINLVTTAPFPSKEASDCFLAIFNRELFSLYPNGRQVKATNKMKEAAIKMVNSKGIVLCKSDERYDCQYCDDDEAITAIRPENGGGERHSCPPTHCGKCVAEQVESGDHSIGDFIRADRFPMDCQCGRDALATMKSCSIHHGEKKKCNGCPKLGCYRNSTWCLECINNDVPGKDKKCNGCPAIGCYRLGLLCRGCLGDIGACSKCGGDKEAGNHKYCDSCEPLCKEKGCTRLRRSHLFKTSSHLCAVHGDRKRGKKPCAKCGKDRGKGNKSSWCPPCNDICKKCDEVLTDNRKKMSSPNKYYCSKKCLLASQSKN